MTRTTPPSFDEPMLPRDIANESLARCQSHNRLIEAVKHYGSEELDRITDSIRRGEIGR